MVDSEIQVDPELCSGCCTCVLACPINIQIQPLCADGIAPKTNDVVLRVINGVCRVLNYDLCKAKNFSCGLCEALCPNGALKITKKKKVRLL
ncbi:MAG TPA: 4Fe-4S binding protein [Candidatus Deferrimicrobium sp.]|nr:4Fe-4S binding protein [Candidatus Deferrimicrobium sp.]